MKIMALKMYHISQIKEGDNMKIIKRVLKVTGCFFLGFLVGCFAGDFEMAMLGGFASSLMGILD